MSEQKDQNEAACGGSALTAELGNPQQTHGFSVKGDDGSSKREVAITLFEDGSYGIKFTPVRGGKALTAELGYWTDFQCPKCGSYMFGSSRNDDGSWTRHCHGNERWRCDFTAHDSEDSKHFKTFVPNGQN